MNMEAAQIELLTSPLEFLETSDTVTGLAAPKRAVVKMRLINEGMNSKSLHWLPETMRKIAHHFRGVPFRYDLTGQNEGSHTKDRISSPFYDVGWTYSDGRGAWYDEKEHCVWIQGEVTHPEVIERLARTTSDGKREINFGSMGALIRPEDTMCTICHKKPFGRCGHDRGSDYNGQTCGMAPLDVAKGLHVALTNDPADRRAEVAEAVFQDMSTLVDNAAKDSPVSVAPGTPVPSDLHQTIREIVTEMLTAKRKEQVVGQDASMEADDMTEEEKKKKKKDSENVTEKKEESVEKQTQQGSMDPDLSKSSLKAGKNPDTEGKNPDNAVKSEKTSVSKQSVKQETADEMDNEIAKDKKEENKGKIQKKAEDTDDTDDEKIKKKAQKEKKEVADASVGDAFDNQEIHLRSVARQQPEVLSQNAETIAAGRPAANAPRLETADNVYEQKYRAKLLRELADAYVQFNKADSIDAATKLLNTKTTEQLEIFQEAFDGLVPVHTAQVSSPAPAPVAAPVPAARPKLELQNASHPRNMKPIFQDAVPEFGGTVEQEPIAEFQDMSADERRRAFGSFGSFDLCFNPGNAHRYSKQ